MIGGDELASAWLTTPFVKAASPSGISDPARAARAGESTHYESGCMTKIIRSFISVAAMLSTVACTSTVFHESDVKTVPVQGLPLSQEGVTTVVVQSGDSLYGIASRKGISVRDLAARNGIAEPYTIHPGQRLRLSPQDTPAAELRRNAEATTTPLSEAAQIVSQPLPAGTNKSPAQKTIPARAAAAMSPTQRMSTPQDDAASVVVQRGDSLYAIAFAHGIAVRDLAAWNGIATPYTVHPGQRLHLHSQDTRIAGSHNEGGAAKPSRSSPPAPESVVQIDSSIGWRWPAEGPLIGREVATVQPGIDIAGRNGSPVHAAGDGVVMYSGSGLAGYDQLIVIQHNDAWSSAYSHNRKRLVSEGQRVKAGAQIAEMGGIAAAGARLHFEMRYNGVAVDPLKHLPKQ